MATIRKRGNKWNVQIRRSRHKPLSRTFLLKSDAVQWARTTEIALDRGDFIDPACPELRTLACILIRYRDDIASAWRVVHKGCVYNIEGVLPDDNSGLEYLTLPCSQGVNDG